MKVSIKWVPRDLWVGIYIGEATAIPYARYERTVYVCLLPCLPICLTWQGTRTWREPTDD